MCEDEELSVYLQKSLGYALAGENPNECFFLFLGLKTRNGKGTLLESFLNIMNDYGKALSPASISKKSSNNNSPSPDFARLADSRCVSISEPDKNMTLNVALMKRLTGGDSFPTRNLYENVFEYRPQFLILINSNYMLEIDDDTIFTSGRLRIIPFDRYFNESERDVNLKTTFKIPQNASGIFNWLLDGYRLFKEEGLNPPLRALDALRNYREVCDTVALFLEDTLEIVDDDNERVKTSILYPMYEKWCADRDINDKSQKEFVNAIRRKDLLDRHRIDGHVIKGYQLKEKIKIA
jgi:putative DNA primase/helicase